MQYDPFLPPAKAIGHHRGPPPARGAGRVQAAGRQRQPPSPARILMLEDSADDATLIERAARRCDRPLAMTRVSRKDEFQRALRELEPDLVLTDYHLPDTTGLETIETVQRIAPATPVVMVTGRLDDETAVACIKAGAADYVLKDRLTHLGPVIRAALDRRRDQQERSEAEAALESERHKYRALVEHLPAVTYTGTLDAEAAALYVSPQIERILGTPAADWIAAPRLFAERLHSDDRERVLHARHIARSSNTPLDIEYRIAHADGTERWIWERASVLRDHGAQVQGVMFDITSRKRAEIELRRLGAAVEQSANLVAVTDADGRIEHMNAACETATGCTTAELLGLDIRTLFICDADAHLGAEPWRTTRAGTNWAGETRAPRADGKERTFWTTVTPLEDESGRVLSYVWVGQDVTQVRELEMQLRVAQKLESLGELTGGIAHDFNNLLSVILANVEAAEYEATAGSVGLASTLHDIRSAARSGANLVRRLVGFGRRAALDPCPTDLVELTKDVSELLRRLIPAGVRIEVVAAGARTALVDPGSVEQMILNLATNARDAMAGSGRLEIAVEDVEIAAAAALSGPVPPGVYVRVRVRDNGSGMDAGTLQRVFEPFFTTKPEGSGTGLGLAMVYGLVKQQGGHIEVDSTPGAGTTFSLYFPAIAAPPADRVAGSRDETTARITGGTETIMIVEDVETLRQAASRILRGLGYHVHEASDGFEALELFGQFAEDIALVVTDLVMPDMSGVDLINALRGSGNTVPVVLVTGYAPADVNLRHIRERGVTTLQKPWTLDELAGAVRRGIDDAHTFSPPGTA